MRTSRRLSLIFALAFHASASAEVVFSESFESPVVSGFDDNTLPDNGNWIGSTQGYGANDRGLYNESFDWPDTAIFTTPYGSQAYLLNGPNNGMTTAENATGLVVTEGVEVKVSFNAAMLPGATSTGYRVQLVAFDNTEDDSTRNDVRGGIAGTVLATAEGTVTSTDFSEAITFSYTATGTDPTGDDLGIRLLKPDGSVLYDNIRVIVGHDFDPTPESGVIVPSGNVELSWANMTASVGSDVWVDVWFGTDPDPSNGVQVVDADVDGQNITSISVNAPTAGTYYWRVDSYVDGNSSGTPVESDVHVFDVIDTDGDGLPDDYENTHAGNSTGLNPGDDLENDGAGDGLTNAEEYFYGTDPNVADTDGDNLEDGDEINGTAGDRPATNPLLADTDADGLNDDVETNTGVWVSSADTGTNPVDPDWDDDGLLDGVETNDDNYVDKSATGSDPYDADSDDDNVLDWYEVTAAFTDPNNAAEKPPLPYPLPDPDGSSGDTIKPVKVYIMSGQSNMVGFGTVSGTGEGTLDTMVKVQNKFPNLVDGSNNWTTRQDVQYRRVYSEQLLDTPLSAGNVGSLMGPEIGFGYVMGYYHDEPVLLIKSAWGNRGLGWDILPPGNPSYPYEGRVNNITADYTFAGYGESPDLRELGSPSTWSTGNWYAGYEWDRFFMHESEWAHPGVPVENVVDVLDNFATEYPAWAAQGFEIAGFVWWQGDRDRSKMGHAAKYEENLVNLIDSLRNYYTDRYPGQVAPSAPFVLATLGQTAQGDTTPDTDVAIFNAQLAVDGDADNYPAYAGNVKTVYSHPLSAGGASNSHYNKNAVTYMMVGDALGNAMVELLETETPPAPDPMTFEIAPSGTSTTTIGMVAVEATSANGPVEYYFENTTNSDFRDWGTGRTWTNTGLTGGQTYSYRVKARDSNGLEGEWSTTADGTAEADGTAPSPDPMSFEAAPTTLGEDSITMTATTALDINGVEYYFTCTAGGGADSGWQTSKTYTPTGLSHSTEYTYTVKAKDSLGNETADSAAASATTDSPDGTPPDPDPMTFEVTPTAQGENSITMTASTATDDSGVEYYFECTSDSSADSEWQTDTTYTASGLTHSTEYTFLVRARDKSPAQNMTSNSAPASATTDAPDLTAPVISTRNPSNGTPGVDINSSLILSFSEDVKVGTGLITIKNLSDGTQSTIDITDDTQITISNETLTINPSSALLESKDYAIQIAGTAIDDLAGNSFAGISDDTGWFFTTADPPPPGLVFSEDFQSPNITGYVKKSIPDNGKWVASNNASGFGWDNHGLVDADSHTSFDAPEFEAGVSEQAYSLDYNGNSGLTTAEDEIGTLQAGLTYTVIFDVIRDKGSDGTQDDSGYEVYLAVFDADANRAIVQAAPKRTILATKTGTDATDSYTQKSFSYTADGSELDSLGNSAIGNDVGLVFVGGGSSAHFDNVSVSTSSAGGDTTPPTVVSIVDNVSGGPILYGDSVTYTLTFDEDIDATSVGTDDFENSGVASITVDSANTSGDTVTVAVTTAGDNARASADSLTLQIKSGAVIKDLAGNDLDTGTAIADDTTITVNSLYSDWANGNNDANDDDNNDGVTNIIAWLLGATGPDISAVSLLPNSESNANSDLVMTFNLLNADNRGSAIPYIEWSSDLGLNDAWSVADIPESDGTNNGLNFVIVPNGNLNGVTATIPSAEGANGKLFGRFGWRSSR